MTDSHSPEVNALARLRFDREHGAGAWGAFINYVKADVVTKDAARVARICQEVLRQAEQDLTDVKTVLKLH